MTRKICIIYFVFLAQSLVGQIVTSDHLSPKDSKIFAEAKSQTQKGNFKKSIKKYQELIKSNPSFIEGILRLATNYHSIKEYSKSEHLFRDAISKAPEFDPEMYYSLAMVLKDQNKITETISLLEIYTDKQKNNHQKVTKAKFLYEELKFRDFAFKNPVSFSPQKLPESINTPYSEYSPSLTLDDSGIIFTRNNGQEDLYYVKKDSFGNYSPSIPLIGLNTTQNEGAHTMSADGKFLVFTACDRRDTYGSCDLYSASLIDDKWTKPVNIGSKVNNAGWDSHPNLSPDGRTLFFASKRNENIGGADIWMTHRDEKNAWTNPVNLGPIINTAGNDETPFLHPDGQTLYFRSDGRPGMGSFDIYYSRKDSVSGEWQTPVNLGFPINTERQEGGLVVTLDGKKAYFASDIHTESHKSTGNLDIFSFELYEKARPQPSIFVKGYIKDAITMQPIDAEVSVIKLDSGEKIYLQNTGADGTFLTSFSIKNLYACIIIKEGYKFYSQNFDLREVSNFSTPFILDIFLTPAAKLSDSIPIILNNIFFKTGSAELLPESNIEINLLFDFLKAHPSKGITIIGHTDNVGSEADNLRLSEARAKAVQQALLQHGTHPSRINAVGKGETEPLAANDTDDGRKMNRRTEFVIFQIKK